MEMNNKIFKVGMVCLFVNLILLSFINNVGGKTSMIDSVRNETNEPPVADAGGPYYGVEEETIILDGSGSYDPDGYIIEWCWSCSYHLGGDYWTYPIIIGYNETIECSFPAGNHFVFLKVTDNEGASAVNTTPVYVTPPLDYICITSPTGEIIKDANISTNFTIKGYATGYNETIGYAGRVYVEWQVNNTGSNATTSPTHGIASMLNSGWNDGTVIWKADDGKGHIDTVIFNINSTLFSILLNRGWNLITLPFQNNYTASTLCEDINECLLILSWNASIQEFELYVPGLPYDFEIEDGQGYFMGMLHGSIFSSADIPIQTVNVPLYIGWNILGWFKENETTASSLLNSIQGCTVVLKWNSSLQNFDLYAPGTPDFVIKRGEGFLVAVNEESEWHGEG